MNAYSSYATTAAQKLAAAAANNYNLTNSLPFGSPLLKNLSTDKGSCVSNDPTSANQRGCNYKSNATTLAAYTTAANNFSGLGYCSFRDNETCGPTTFTSRYWLNPTDGLLYSVNIDGLLNNPIVTKTNSTNYQMDAFGFYILKD